MTSLRYLTLDEWQRVVEVHPDSTPCHHRSWIELLAQQYGWKYCIPALQCDGQFVGAVPFIEIWHGLFAKTRNLISLPFSDCVPCLRAPQAAVAIVQEMRRSGALCGDEAVVIRTPEPLAGAACVSHWYRHVVELDGPFDHVQSRFADIVERNVRRAESRNLRFDVRKDLAAVDAFYRLHLMTRKKLGVPIQPKSFFARLHEMILRRDLGFVAIVTQDATPIAASIFLTFHKTMIFKFGASDPAALDHRPNEFLLYHVLRAAAETNCARLDLGVSAKEQQGLCRFKRKWGATESDVYHAYLSGTPQPPVDGSRAFRLASLCIRNSPSVVCRVMGELFYRYSQ